MPGERGTCDDGVGGGPGAEGGGGWGYGGVEVVVNGVGGRDGGECIEGLGVLKSRDREMGMGMLGRICWIMFE